MEKMTKLMCMLALGACMAMASCEQENPAEEPAEKITDNQKESRGIFVTVGAGISDAAVRSEVASEDGKRVLKFTAGDKLYVCNPDFGPSYYLAGTLEMESESLSADGKSARFSGEVMAYDSASGNEAPWVDLSGIDPLEETTAYLIHAGTTQGVDYDIESYNHELYYRSQAFDDVETLMTQRLPVTGDYDSGTESYPLSCPYPIFNCTLSGLEASHNYCYILAADEGGGWFLSATTALFTTDANGNAHFAFLSYHDEEKAWELRIEDDDTDALVGTVDLGTRAFTSKVYNVSRYWTGSEFTKAVDLSTITGSCVILVGSGMTVANNAAYNNCDITIVDGATVTLKDVFQINTVNPCVSCLGDATIILSGDNTINSNKAGIYVPEDKTLTIRGDGSLDVVSNSNAAIGAYSTNPCGSIVIEGGTIFARGNKAGIGGAGNIASCQNITISGGTIEAYSSNNSAAIGCGSGYQSRCGDITITGGTIKVAQCIDGNGAAGIGSGRYATCGNITISGGTIGEDWDEGAIGSSGAPGIGAGASGKCGSITITDGIDCIYSTKAPSNSCQVIGLGQYASFVNAGDKVTIDSVELTSDQLISPDEYLTDPATFPNLSFNTVGNECLMLYRP